MMSQIPQKIDEINSDKQICRVGMIAELDAVSLYEQMAALAKDRGLKKILLDIAKEEKTHKGEFEAILLKFDKEQGVENKKGADEVKEKI